MDERLRQLELVGCGAMAEVYRGALHGEHGTSRPVAIKRLRPELREEPAAVDLFVNEARLAVRMHHPNVVTALELARDELGYALVCEWLECASLQQLCDRGDKLPPFAVVHVGRCLCDALHYLHELRRDDGEPMGLVHRDITPANVFLTRGGEVKLADFGVAWCKDDTEATIAGTPEFAAPEQQRGNDIDARADIYGLGATLRAAAREVPPDLAAVLDQACAEDRDARFASAREVSLALAGVSAKLGSTTAQHRIAELMSECATEDSTITAPRIDGAVQSILGSALTSSDASVAAATPEPPATRRRWLWALAVLPVLVGLGAYAWQQTHSPEPATPPEPTPPPVAPPPVVTAPVVTEPDTVPQKPPSAPPPREVVVAKGLVSLNAVPWAKVKIDGRDVGNTPLKSVSLAAGRHIVTLFNPAQRLRKEVAIEVDANRTQTFLVDLRRGTVQKRTHP